MSSINFDLETDVRFDDLANDLQDITGRNLSRIVAREVVPELERYTDRVVDELRIEPGAVRHPFVWSDDPVKNARGRRAFFARYPNGYTRTHQLVRQWQGIVNFARAQLTIAIQNFSAGASFVYGAEAFGFRQVPGHQTTGWLNAGVSVPDKLLKIGVVAETLLTEALEKELDRL